MSLSAARTSRTASGAVTPVRTRARTAFSQPATRRSHGVAPTGVCSAAWSRGEVGHARVELAVRVRLVEAEDLARRSGP